MGGGEEGKNGRREEGGRAWKRKMRGNVKNWRRRIIIIKGEGQKERFYE